MSLRVTLVWNVFAEASESVEELIDTALLEFTATFTEACVKEAATIAEGRAAHALLINCVPVEVTTADLRKSFAIARREIVERAHWAVASVSVSALSNTSVPVLSFSAPVVVYEDALAVLVVPNLLWKNCKSSCEASTWIITHAFSSEVIVELVRCSGQSFAITRLKQASAC